MKTRNWVLTALVLFVVATINATNLPKMSVELVANEKIGVDFESVKPCPVEITISKGNGDIVYFVQSKKRDCEFSEVFDFSEMENGTYKISLNYGNQSVNRELQVGNKNVKIGPERRSFEPYYKLENGKLDVSFLNVARKNVYLRVYKDGEIVSSIKLGKDMNIQKRMDFTKLEKGKYNLVLAEELETHCYHMEI
jgi:hypothetical protein